MDEEGGIFKLWNSFLTHRFGVGDFEKIYNLLWNPDILVPIWDMVKGLEEVKSDLNFK